MSGCTGERCWLRYAHVRRLGRVRLLRVAFAVLLGLRLHLVCTLHGLPVGWVLTAAIWHHDHLAGHTRCSLTAYDH